MEKTTIQIDFSTLEKLKMLRAFERQSYDDVLNILIENQEQETLSDKEIEEIKVGLENVRKGETISIEDLARELGVKLH